MAGGLATPAWLEALAVRSSTANRPHVNPASFILEKNE
jgi:hypothetical protein